MNGSSRIVAGCTASSQTFVLTRLSSAIAALLVCLALPPTGMGESAQPKQVAQPQGTPRSTLMVHLTTAPAALSDAYAKAEDLAREETRGQWITLGPKLGSIQAPWWRHRLAWNMTGPRLEVDEEVHYSLAHAVGSHVGAGSPTRCGLTPPADPPGVLHLRHQSTLSLSPQYAPHAADTRIGLDWKARCALPSLPGDPIPVLTPRFKSERERIATLLTSKLGEAWPIKSRLSQIWTGLQEPILVDERTNTWLLLHPHATHAGPMNLRNGRLAATVGVDIRPVLMRGTRPTPRSSALPTASAGLSSSRLNSTLEVPVPFQEADERLREALVGQQFGQGVGTVTVLAVRFTPAGERAQVDLDLDLAGLTTVTLQLTGKPVLDEPSQSVSFSQLDYAIKNRSALADFAESLLHDEFRRQLERRLTIPLTARLEEARRLANETLSRDWKGGRLDGTLTALRILRLAMERTHFVASIQTEGELHYTVATHPAPSVTAPPTAR